MTGAQTAPTTSPIARQNQEWSTYHSIRKTLDQTGRTMDYDTLMQVHQAMAQSPHPIAQMDQLLGRLIQKRNADPRIDQMILIFAARTIGGSQHPIPNAQGLFESILQQDERVNQWVISFVAEAIGDYPWDLPRGDRLVDFMETKLAQLRSKDRSRKENFGFHFLPPPKSDFICAYINGIEEQSVRQQERNRYYMLIKSNLTEKEIEPALKYLQARGAPGSGEKCPYLMACLMRYRHQMPFERQVGP